MTAANSNRKPRKPKGSPLTVHPNGQWSKKINGRVHYFGSWSDHDGALAQYHATAEALRKGQTPTAGQTELNTVADICNAFLADKESLVESGELAARTFREYQQSCLRLAAHFGRNRRVAGISPDEFGPYRAKLAKTRNGNSLKNEIHRVRTLFNYAWENDMISKPIKYGSVFRPPAKKVIRKQSNAKPKRLFAASEIRLMLDGKDDGEGKLVKADRQLRAMILLAINSGIGNHDIGCLPIDAIDFKGNWLDYAREKTGINRRVPLWEKTVDALREVIEHRREPIDEADKGLIFITKYRRRWVRDTGTTWIDNISRQCGKLLKSLEIDRDGVNFYALRHTFQTVGDETGLYVAVKALMGHADDDSDMSANYRQATSDENLRAVVDHVHQWLFDGARNGR